MVPRIRLMITVKPFINDAADCTLSLRSCRAEPVNFEENLTERLCGLDTVSRSSH
jgi:hypothetical protein